MSRFYNSIARLLLGTPAGLPLGYFSQGNTQLPTDITVDEALRCGTVMSCVNLIAKGISEVEFTAPENKALNEVLHYPNIYQSRSNFIYSSVWDMLLSGHALAEIEGDTKKPTMLASHDPDNIRLTVEEGTRRPVYHDIYQDKRIPGTQMLRVQDMPTNSVIGYSRISAYASKIHAIIAADRLMLNTFKNGISLGYTLNTDQELGDTQFKKIRALMAQFVSNLYGKVPGEDDKKKGDDDTKQGGFIILEQGLQLNQIKGMTPADAELLALRDVLKVEIAAAFDVPPFLVGGPSDSKYNNMTSRVTSLYKQAMSPVITNFKDALEHRFKTPIEANDEVLQKGDFATQITNAIGLVTNALWTPNEIRDRIFDMEGVEDGDKLRFAMGGGPQRPDRRGEFPTDDGSGKPVPNSD